MPSIAIGVTYALSKELPEKEALSLSRAVASHFLALFIIMIFYDTVSHPEINFSNEDFDAFESEEIKIPEMSLIFKVSISIITAVLLFLCGRAAIRAVPGLSEVMGVSPRFFLIIVIPLIVEIPRVVACAALAMTNNVRRRFPVNSI